MQRLPQHGNDSLFTLFHTPRFCNRGYQATSPSRRTWASGLPNPDLSNRVQVFSIVVSPALG